MGKEAVGGVEAYNRIRVSYRINESAHSRSDVSLVTKARVTFVKLQVAKLDFYEDTSRKMKYYTFPMVECFI